MADLPDIVQRLHILATDHEHDETIPEVVLEAADEIKALREVVSVLGVYPFTGGRHDPFIAAAVQIGVTASPGAIAAVRRALPAQDIGSSQDHGA